MKASVSSSSCRRSLSTAFSFLTIGTILLFNRASLARQSANAGISPTPQPLITQAIDETQLTTLTGNTHPLARPQFDLGTAPATLPMERMLLVLKRSPQQEAALQKLLDDQQDKNSPNYHEWLTPEEFGKQFGPTDADIQTITAWLQSHGFQVGATKGRTVLEFSGSASQVQQAFHTTIHKYLVNGEQHWANASDPQIPTALTPAVAGIDSLNDFPRHPMNAPAGEFKRDPATGKIEAVKPLYTFPSGCIQDDTSSNACYYGVGPYDFAKIYNVQPLWTAGTNGTGQTIAIVGETNINPQDVANFRSLFGLAANPPNIILNGPDPGIVGDESEADIDVQWSGAVAPNATIDFVVSQSTETTAGIDLSAYYIIENNLAGVMSESYGYCELGLGTAGNQFYSNLWQQAAAQGITAFVSAGDGGAAGCDNFNAAPPAPAQYGLQVSGFTSTPYNVSVGGTDFNDFSNPATYWSTTNNSTTQASALSYIPETTWNDSCTNSIFSTLGFSTSAETNCNNSQLQGFVIPEGGSGGMSACTTPSGETPASCAGGYAKPTWQSGTGVPSDGKRDIPDVSLFASNGFVGSFYIICQSDETPSGTCDLNAPYQDFLGFGGTSVSSPAFAGIMALVNQQHGRQGNANYVLYKLAGKSGASCTSAVGNGTSSSCIFNDVVSGTNAMPCATGSPNCTTSLAGDAYGVLTGYATNAGYDLATGLGSVNAQNLVSKWNSVSLMPSATTLNISTAMPVTHGQGVTFSGTVQPQSGTGAAPTGQISLTGGPSTNPSQGSGAFTLTSSGAFSGTTDMLPAGTYSVTANYPGDSNYSSSNSSGINVTVNKENSQPQVFLVTLDSNGNVINGDTTTATYGSLYLLRVNVQNSAGQMCNPVATSGTTQTACPTGTVSITNNGTPFDAGTYTLNSYGYFEDQNLQTDQLPGGTDSVKAAYSGDNNFNASNATTAITITPAATSMSAFSFASLSVGATLSVSVTVSATSSGAAPTGGVTFSVNGTPVSGQTTYSASAGTASSPIASLFASFVSSASPFPSSGSYAISASYSGDQNYAASAVPAQSISVQYPVPTVTVTPATQYVNSGATANLAALIDSSNKTAYPTGTVTFLNYGTGAVLSGPTVCASTKDSSGNYACQASASITVTSAVTVSAQYSGDTNYPSNSVTAQIGVNDFSLTAGSATITQGSSTQTTINVTALGNFNGTVSSFSCSGLPAEATCSFNPTSVTGAGSTTLTINTAAIGQLRHHAANEKPRLGWMAAILPFAGIFLIGIPARERKKAFLASLLVLALIATFPSCGGSGGGGGGGNQNNPVPAITSLSPTQQVAGSTPQNLTINGTGFVTSSTVTFNGAAHSANYVSGTQLTTYLLPGDLAVAGNFPVVVTNPAPGGGASSPVNFDVVSKGTPTGNFTVTVTASSGSLTHSTTFALTVQSAN
jgi:subtilase family serine protease